MWKWMALVCFPLLVIQGANSLRLTAVAKETSPEFNQPRRLANEAMTKIKENDIHGAFASLAEVALFNAPQIDAAADQVLKTRDGLNQVWGKPIGEVEFVRIESIGKSFVRFVYLEKYQRHAMVWKLTFYQAGDWKLQDVNWDANPQVLGALFQPDSALAELPQ